jgi:hypothetical protein
VLTLRGRTVPSCETVFYSLCRLHFVIQLHRNHGVA